MCGGACEDQNVTGGTESPECVCTRIRWTVARRAVKLVASRCTRSCAPKVCVAPRARLGGGLGFLRAPQFLST